MLYVLSTLGIVSYLERWVCVAWKQCGYKQVR